MVKILLRSGAAMVNKQPIMLRTSVVACLQPRKESTSAGCGLLNVIPGISFNIKYVSAKINPHTAVTFQHWWSYNCSLP